MAIFLYSKDHDLDAWVAELRRELPDVRISSDPSDHPDGYRMALVWNAPATLFSGMDNLALVHSTGAGVDHITRLPLDERIRICRIVDPSMATQMTQYCLLHVLRRHRHLEAYADQQEDRVWKRIPTCNAEDYHVGILGLGALGTHIAQGLRHLGYTVMGWKRSSSAAPEFPVFTGREGLETVLRNADHLIALLPNTPATAGLLDRAAFSMMKPGSCLIHVGRPQQLDYDALSAALDAGVLAEAVIDVFDSEPLDSDSPLWTQPGLKITPHVAAFPRVDRTMRIVSENYRRLISGAPLLHEIDRTEGY